MSEKTPCRGSSCLKLVLSGLIVGVVLVGVAAYAMRVTDSRPFCGTCHPMQEAALTHKLSSHASLACNECHAPSNLLAKLPFKAKEGLRDFVSNLQGNEAPLLPSVTTRDVINENCKSCHVNTNTDVASMDAKPYCVDCHRNLAHMRSKPISTRTVAYDK